MFGEIYTWKKSWIGGSASSDRYRAKGRLVMRGGSLELFRLITRGRGPATNISSETWMYNVSWTGLEMWYIGRFVLISPATEQVTMQQSETWMYNVSWTGLEMWFIGRFVLISPPTEQVTMQQLFSFHLQYNKLQCNSYSHFIWSITSYNVTNVLISSK